MTQKKQYTAEFKFKAVMESYQRDTTIEEVCRKFGLASSVLHRWRKEFQENGLSTGGRTVDQFLQSGASS